jgi:hypothetical protein
MNEIKNIESNKNIQNTSAWIKMTKSEIEWIIISLNISEKSSEIHDKSGNSIAFRQLQRDFIRIKNKIMKGEEEYETRNKTEEENRNGAQACESCVD